VDCAPAWIAIAPTTSKAYVCNLNDHTFSVINLTTNTVLASSIPTGGDSPDGIAFTPDGSKGYICNGGSNTVSVLQTSTDTISSVITGVPFPYAVAVSPEADKAYVCDFVGNTTTVINTQNDTVATSFPVGDGPFAIAMSHAITPPPSPLKPPKKFVGTIKRELHAYRRKAILCLKWKKTPSSVLDHYEIFANHKRIASIPATDSPSYRLPIYSHNLLQLHLPHSYIRELRKKYRIRAVATDNSKTAFTYLRVSRLVNISYLGITQEG
jgi:YVTN family beta-propeller protein